jgi:hypothetical protein
MVEGVCFFQVWVCRGAEPSGHRAQQRSIRVSESVSLDYFGGFLSTRHSIRTIGPSHCDPHSISVVGPLEFYYKVWPGMETMLVRVIDEPPLFSGSGSEPKRFDPGHPMKLTHLRD